MHDARGYRQQVVQASEYIRGKTDLTPRIGLILGTGLGALADEIDTSLELSYRDIPHFPVSTVESHHGKFLGGDLQGVPVFAMQGRFHLYEGYSARQVTFPIRVLRMLGIDTLLISNAAGGMNPEYSCSDLMLVKDHINLQGENPLIGPNDEEWGPRFPDMSEPYDADLRGMAHTVALEHNISLKEGVYVAVVGPNLETRAEYRFLRTIGADAVGMSTVPEVIVARHMNLRVMAISVITDECFPETLKPVSIQEVLASARAAEPKLAEIMKGVVTRVGEQTALQQI